MFQVVVQPLEDDILKRDPTLMREVIVANKVDHLLRRKSLLHRHQGEALLRVGGMQAESQMAFALLQEATQPLHRPDRRDGDALWAPAIPPGRRQDLQHLEELIHIVQRLTHAHKDQISERLTLRQRLNLVQDLVSGQIGGETLLTGHAKEAIHLAAYLRGNAERRPVLRRDIDRLHKMSFASRIEILDRAIHRTLRHSWRISAHLITLRQGRPFSQGHVRHLRHLCDVFLIQPVSHLLRRIAGKPHLRSHLLQLRQGHSHQFLLLYHCLSMLCNPTKIQEIFK